MSYTGSKSLRRIRAVVGCGVDRVSSAVKKKKIIEKKKVPSCQLAESKLAYFKF